jgi:hypothetical protein
MRGQPRRPILNMSGGPRAALGLAVPPRPGHRHRAEEEPMNTLRRRWRMWRFRRWQKRYLDDRYDIFADWEPMEAGTERC